jgi:hypothetical protein
MTPLRRLLATLADAFRFPPETAAALYPARDVFTDIVRGPLPDGAKGAQSGCNVLVGPWPPCDCADSVYAPSGAVKGELC